MNIGDESVAMYVGYEDGLLSFRLLPSLQTVNLPTDSVMGSSILNTAQQFVLHRNTVTTYTVRVA